MRNVIVDLIKIWGVQKVVEGLIFTLRKQGASEQMLASDLDRDLDAYRKRSDKKK